MTYIEQYELDAAWARKVIGWIVFAIFAILLCGSAAFLLLD